MVRPKAASRKSTRSSKDPGTSGIRLQKLLAAAGFSSRRGAEELIRAGRVTVNGRRAGVGDRADPSRDEVALDGERIRPERPLYWVLNKPTGVVTTVRDPHGRSTVMQFLPEGLGRIHPVGRLDRDSSGLLLMTNDGELTQQLLHPSRESEKEYRVHVKGELEPRTLERLRRGVRLDDGPSAPVHVGSVRFEADSQTSRLLLTLTEGRKRQIRRTLFRLGHPVRKLTRIRIGPLRLGRLAVGAARPLRSEEVRALKAYAAGLEQKPRPRRRSRKPSTRAKR
ncbi:MAG: pseudouridine synthase [Myxococcota bacterium]